MSTYKYNISTSRFGILAKVKVLDKESGLCFEKPIYPETVTTNNFCGFSETSLSFSPVNVPDPEYWNAKWDDKREKLRGLRGVSCVDSDLRGLRGVSYTVSDLRVKKIIFSGPCTIVLWEDGTKTIARVSDGDKFDPEKGVAVCFMKRSLGHTETNKILRTANKQYKEAKK